MGQGSMPVLGGDQAAHGRDLAHLDRIPIKARENPLWFREVTPFDERLTAFQVALVGFAAPQARSSGTCLPTIEPALTTAREVFATSPLRSVHER